MRLVIHPLANPSLKLVHWWVITSHRWTLLLHDDVIKWKHFPRYCPFVQGIHRSPVNSPHKGQWRGALMFSLICSWTNVWINNGDAGDLKRYRAHCDFTVLYAWPNLTKGLRHTYHNGRRFVWPTRRLRNPLSLGIGGWNLAIQRDFLRAAGFQSAHRDSRFHDFKKCGQQNPDMENLLGRLPKHHPLTGSVSAMYGNISGKSNSLSLGWSGTVNTCRYTGNKIQPHCSKWWAILPAIRQQKISKNIFNSLSYWICGCSFTL